MILLAISVLKAMEMEMEIVRVVHLNQVEMVEVLLNHHQVQIVTE
jgi:hypothetical protein